MIWSPPGWRRASGSTSGVNRGAPVAAQNRGGVFGASPPQSHCSQAVSNWVTKYSEGDQRPSRFEPTPGYWREFEAQLQRWGGASSWKRLEQLGQVAKTNQ